MPSRLTFKRLKKICLNKKKIAFVDVDLVDNIELCEHYKVPKLNELGDESSSLHCHGR